MRSLVLPLPQMVAEAQAAHLAQFGANDEGYVFTNARGLLYQAHTYQYRLRVQAQRVGLPPVTSHYLRHSYASWLLLAGEFVVTVAARLGPKDASKVISTYGHLVPGTEDRTRGAIDSAWSPRCALATGNPQLSWSFIRPRRSGTPRGANLGRLLYTESDQANGLARRR